MRIGGSTHGTFGHDRKTPAEPQPSAAPASRALTVLAHTVSREVPPLGRGDAAFLAHLIATKEQVPQARTKRRAEPDEAIAAYRAVAALRR